MSDVKKCRYCREGHVTNEKGEHWIVKSVFPARITIKPCADFKPAISRPEPTP